MTRRPLHHWCQTALLFAALAGASSAVGAADFTISTASQGDFHAVAEDLTAAFDDKVLGASAGGGLLGFSVTGFGSYAPTHNADAWARLTGSRIDGLGVVGVRADKGLPFGLGIGGFYGRVPGSDASTYGGSLRYAILPGGVLTPELALRGTYTRASNTGDLDYRSYGGDLTLSKGILFFNPYVGAGYVHSNTRADGRFGLREEDLDRAKFFAGVGLHVLLVSGLFEYERLGHDNVYSLTAGISF